MVIRRKRTTTRKRTTAKRKTTRRSTARRSTARRTVKRAPARRAPTRRKVIASKRAATETKKKIGEITHFFDRINVAVIKLNGALRVGDRISIEGATTNFKQKVASMQIEHKSIQQARKGQAIGMKVKDTVREKDLVYKV